MNIEEMSNMTESELRGRANTCLEHFETESAMEREHHVAEAQFYLAEIERRKHAEERIEGEKIASRDYNLEIWVIVLIGAELLLAVVAIVFGWVEGNRQMEVLDKLNKSGTATAETLTAVRQAQEASLDTQKHTLENIVSMNTALQDELGLNYAVSVALVYDSSQVRMVILNKGKTNLSLLGDKLDGQPPAVEKEPRIITPDGLYYLEAASLKKELTEKMTEGSHMQVQFDLYLKSANGKKYTAKSYLLVTRENNTLKINTQIVSVSPTR